VTEQEWSNCADRDKMLKFLRGKASERKLRLFITNCCRRTWHLITDNRCRRAIEIAERFADGLTSKKVMAQVRKEVSQVEAETTADRRAAKEQPDARWKAQLAGFGISSCLRAVRPSITPMLPRFAAENMARAVGYMTFANDPSVVWSEEYHAERKAEEKAQCNLLRHIMGNRFNPYPGPAGWPSAAVQLAEALYAGSDCAFALHDALLEAGHVELAEHFKDKDHPKRCWALDLLLGKE